jgi:hypothetical protein
VHLPGAAVLRAPASRRWTGGGITRIIDLRNKVDAASTPPKATAPTDGPFERRCLDDLRSSIGDEAFHFPERLCPTECREDRRRGSFFEILAQHTQEDLTPLISHYFKDR